MEAHLDYVSQLPRIVPRDAVSELTIACPGTSDF